MTPLDLPGAVYTTDLEKRKPVISNTAVVLFSIICTLCYVVPLYISRSSRPRATVSRDAPATIKLRVRIVTVSTFLCSLGMYFYMVNKAHFLPSEALRLLGWWPIGLPEIFKTFLLTCLLFMGPLFEQGIAEGEWKNWVQGREMIQSLSGWIGWRNYVAGPITEEVTFRSLIVPLHLMAHVSPTQIVFTAPLYFGIAHAPHLYEFRMTHPHVSWATSLLRTFFQFGFTTVFGWFATFIYLRTGSLPAVILIHSFCNYCGLPRLLGRVGKDLRWTIAYYIILVAGVFAFYFQLWPLTESMNALASFAAVSS